MKAPNTLWRIKPDVAQPMGIHGGEVNMPISVIATSRVEERRMCTTALLYFKLEETNVCKHFHICMLPCCTQKSRAKLFFLGFASFPCLQQLISRIAGKARHHHKSGRHSMTQNLTSLPPATCFSEDTCFVLLHKRCICISTRSMHPACWSRWSPAMDRKNIRNTNISTFYIIHTTCCTACLPVEKIAF